MQPFPPRRCEIPVAKAKTATKKSGNIYIGIGG